MLTSKEHCPTLIKSCDRIYACSAGSIAGKVQETTSKLLYYEDLEKQGDQIDCFVLLTVTLL